MVRPIVHTNPSRKRSFSKTLFKPEEFENARFTVEENILKTELEKTMTSRKSCDFPDRVFLSNKSKMTGD